MTALDIITLLLVGGGLIRGFMRGFTCELLSLFAWVAAIMAVKLFHSQASEALTDTIGTYAGAAVLAFALTFGAVFLLGKLIAGRMGSAMRQSAVGPVDRVLGGGFGILKGLLIATTLYLAANLVYDTMNGRRAVRPDWMKDSRAYPLLDASGRAIVDFVERSRGPALEEPAGQEGTAD